MRVVERRVARAVQDGEERALVLLGRELGGGPGEHEAGGAEERQHHQDGDRAVVERARHPPLVPVRHPVEGAVDDALEAAALAGLQEPRRHGRRDRQRDDAGDDHRAGEREGELAEERAGQPAGEAERREHGGERQRHGDHRAGDLLHADDRGVERRQALLDVAVDVLDHDDGVVDDEADGQHHGEEREEVERVAEREQHRADADQRQRDGHDRHQHRAERAEEEQDHQRRRSRPPRRWS